MNQPPQSKVFQGKQADLGESQSKVSTGLSYSPVLTFNTNAKRPHRYWIQWSILPKQPWLMAMVSFISCPCFGSVPTAKQVRPVAMQPACSRVLFHTHNLNPYSSHAEIMFCSSGWTSMNYLNSCSIYKDSKIKLKEVSGRVCCEWDGGLYRWVDKTASHHLKTCPTLGSTRGQGQLH